MIPTTTALAIRCPQCGSIKYLAISLFAFSHSNSIELGCSCGTNLVKIATKKARDKKKSFWLQYNCAMCDGRHLKKLSRRQMWSPDTSVELVCDDTGIDIGYIGSKESVKNRMNNQDKSLAEMAEKLGFTDFFNDSSIMYDVLEHIYEIAESGRLSCSCGNLDIEIEIFPEHLELSCDRCKCKGRIMAETEEDLQAIKRTWELKLTSKGFALRNKRDYR